MSRTVKIVAICFVMILLAGAVTGVALLSANYKPAPEKIGLEVDGKLIEDPGTMMKVGPYDISFADYRYFYMTLKKSFDTYYGESIWATDFDGYNASQLKEQTEKYIKEAYALLTLAQEEGLTLTEEDKAGIVEEMAAQKEQLGDEYESRLHELYFVDEAMYQRIAEQQLLQRKAREDYTAKLVEENGDSIIEDTVFTAKHILIGPVYETDEGDTSDVSGVDSSSVPTSESQTESDSMAQDDSAVDDSTPEVSEEEAAERAMELAKEKAEDLVRQIRESDDPAATFEELMLEYTEDPGLETSPDGYTFGEGEMVDEFYNGTKALDEGEISDPIKSDYGYHIIMRLPLDEEYLAENRDSIIDSKVSDMVAKRLESIGNSMEVTYGEYYDKVSPKTIK